MKIAIGSDHIGFALKKMIIEQLKAQNHEVIDCGPSDCSRTHYPLFGHKVGTLVALHKVDRGIIMCGTGIGIANAANKTRHIRCALVNSSYAAKQAVINLNANIIAFGSKVTGEGLALQIADAFVNTVYEPNATKDNHIQIIDELIHHDNFADDMFAAEEVKWEAGYYHD